MLVTFIKAAVDHLINPLLSSAHHAPCRMESISHLIEFSYKKVTGPLRAFKDLSLIITVDLWRVVYLGAELPYFLPFLGNVVCK